MELTAEQDAQVKELCREIKPGAYGKVVITFVGSPSNQTQITGEKSFRFHNEKASPSFGEPHDRLDQGRIGNRNFDKKA